MFEKFIAPVINKILGDYVGNLESKQLSVGIWQGDVALHNLKLKKEALDKFNLPVEVVDGYLGDLTLSIPWNDLKNKPVKIFINHVFLLARPKAAAEYDPVEEEETAYKAKLQKLETADLLLNRSKEPHLDGNKNDSTFMNQLVTKIVDNVQISMKNIHIRYEDRISNPEYPFSVGITLEELSAVSCDSNWQETFLHEQANIIHKVIKLASLSMYFNTHSTTFSAKTPEEFMANFQKSIATAENVPEGYQYILKPVSGNAKVITHKHQPAEGPRHNASLEFNELAFVLDKEQFTNSVSLLGAFSSYLRSQKYRRFRPPRTITPSLDPAAWFQFAGKSVLSDIHERNRKWTWEYLSERRDDRIIYTGLYKLLKEGSLAGEDLRTFEDMERKLSFEDIMLYRSIALSQMRKLPKVKKTIVPEVAAVKPSTWGSGISNWWSGKSQEQQTTASESSILTDDQMKQLYDTIEFDPNAATPVVNLPKDAALLAIQSTLKSGSFSLKESPNAGEVLISLVFQDFNAAVTQFVAGSTGNITLGNMTLNDGTTPNTLYPTLIRAKNDKQDVTQGQLQGPFFTMAVEHNPLDGRADDAVSIVMLPLEVIYNPLAIKALTSFFTPPKSESSAIYTITAAAQDTFDGLTAQTKAGLEYAVAEHRTLDLKIDFAAPIFLLPQSCTDPNCMVMLVDAGHFLLESNYVNKEQKRELQQKHGALRSAHDLGELQSLLYDRFTCKLSSVQVLIGQSVERCLEQAVAETAHGNLHMVERVNLSFSLELCILPKLTDYSRIRIIGNLPRLHLNISDRKYKTMMNIIDLVLESLPGSNNSDEPGTTSGELEGTWGFMDSRPALDYVKVDEDGEDSFYDAPEEISRDHRSDNRSEITDDSVNRVAVELNFEVNQASISLMKSEKDLGTADRVLADLTVENFGMTVRAMTHELDVNIKIRAVEIEDRMQPGQPAFRYLLSPTVGSDMMSVASDRSTVDQLIRVSYVGLKPTSPDYNGIDQSLDISFAAVTVVLTSSSVLMLYDFILSTFTNPENSVPRPAPLVEGTENRPLDQKPPPRASSLVVRANMKSISFIINQDGTRIATLLFGELETQVQMKGTTMVVGGSIGDLSIVDDVNRVEQRQYNELLQIEGEEVAHFEWKTFDPTALGYPGYDTALTLKASSITFTYLESLLHGLMDFFSKFAKMHALLVSARNAAIESAHQIQQAAGKFHYDIEIQSPVLVFPRLSLQSRDRMTLYPGSISARNTFETTEDGLTLDCLAATIHSMKVLSRFRDEGSANEEQILNDLDVTLSMRNHTGGVARFDLEDSVKFEHMFPLNRRSSNLNDLQIEVAVSEVHMKMTPEQYAFVFTVLESLRSFSAPPNSEAIEEAGVGVEAKERSADYPVQSQQAGVVSTSVPQLTKKMKVQIPSICLEIFQFNTRGDSKVANPSALARFAINDASFELVSGANDASEMELLVRSLAITDTRVDHKNLFREIMPSAGRQDHQLRVQVSSHSDGSQTVATISGATLLLIPDHIFLVQDFFMVPLKSDKPTGSAQNSRAMDSSDEPEPSPRGVPTYRLNLVDLEVLLLQDASVQSTEAIVLTSKRISASQDEVATAKIHDLGMFLCQMDKREETTVPFIQGFHATLAYDDKKGSLAKPIKIAQLDLSPIVLRVSYRDMLLIMDIVNGILALMNKAAASEERPLVTEGDTDDEATENAAVIQSQERLHATLECFRLLLIDDLNDLHLPMLDIVMDKLIVTLGDWSSTMRLEMMPSLHVNYFNVTNSHWEPLVEQWQFIINLAQQADKGTMSLDCISKKRLEINVTHTFVDTVLSTMDLLTKQGRRVLTSRRGTHAPYVLKNRTGYEMYVWADSTESGLDTELKHLPNGNDIPWRFEDWRTMREGTSPALHRVSLQLNGPSWETVKSIPIDRKGSKTYVLRPAVHRVAHRLICDVKLKDNVKVVTFRSAMGVLNSTNVPVDVVVVNSKKQRTSPVTAVKPGESFYVPIEASYHDMIQIRPQEGLGYEWSHDPLFWRDMQNRATALIACRSSDPTVPAFRFLINCLHAEGIKDSTYPNMTFELLPPLQLENLLPYDLRYKLYDRTDRNSRQQHTETLHEGGLHPVYMIDPTHLIALGVEIVDSAYLPSEIAIITNSDLDYRDETIRLSDAGGQQLLLRLKYNDKPTGGGPKISIFSPYVVLNKTGLDITFSTRSLMGVSRYASPAAKTDQGLRPVLFSFPNFEPVRSRVQIKTHGSDWSKPISFDAVGSAFDIPIQDNKTRSEAHIGTSIKEGVGKYFMTKVVTFAPRFILKNNMDEDLQIRPAGTTEGVNLAASQSLPLHTLKMMDGKQQHDVCIRFTGLMNEWSNPININQVGRVYMKLGRMSSPDQDLVRVELQIQDATIFVVFAGRETRWPFRIDNKTETDVDIWQHGSKTRFKVPRGESRPYSWDFPSAARKALILSANGREREIDVLEIGQLVPFKYPGGIMAMDVFAEGPTIAVKLSPYVESKSAFKNTNDPSSSAATIPPPEGESKESQFLMKVKETKLLMAMQVRFEGIGISVINANMQEILYVSARKLQFALTDSTTNQALTFSMKWLQVDNQLYGGLEPIFLYPSVIPKEGEEDYHPVLMITLSRSKDPSYGVEYFDWFTILLQELSVDMDEEFLMTLLEFSKFNVPGWDEDKSELCDTRAEIQEPSITNESRRLYFEKFLLQPVQINVSFVRTQNSNMEEARPGRQGVLSFVLDVLTMTLGNIHDAPLRLNALELRHPNVTPNQLMDLIFKFYTQELVGQIHKVIGSADFLGNPVGLFNNVSSGVSDFFYEPLQGFDITRPQDFGIGVAKGTASLFRKTVFGASDTFSKFTGSLGKGLSVITMDSEFQERRRLSSIRNRPRHAVYGVTTGAASLARSVASGVSGVVSKPFEGAQEEGVGGFFKGLGKGIVGVVTKPVIGVIDLATNVGEGIRNTTTVFDTDLDRQRLPRFIGRDRVLKPYNNREALGLNWLKGMENGRFFHEEYLGHLDLRIEDLVVLVTDQRVLMARIKRLKIDWDIPYDDVQSVRVERSGAIVGVTIVRRGRQQQRNRFIQCPDQASAQSLCAMIEGAFAEYIEQSRDVE
ncbi:hypothetical protein HDU88_007532 [Geranomyces variabilis]|nr:hypothetical protein HDU88_007532 [Geranomyces variabilis]